MTRTNPLFIFDFGIFLLIYQLMLLYIIILIEPAARHGEDNQVVVQRGRGI
jgi:hypothetical protein